MGQKFLSGLDRQECLSRRTGNLSYFVWWATGKTCGIRRLCLKRGKELAQVAAELDRVAGGVFRLGWNLHQSRVR